MAALTLAAVALAVALAALGAQLWEPRRWLPSAGRVVVHTSRGSIFTGRLVRSRGGLLVLGDVAEVNRGGREDPIPGELVLQRGIVDWVQVTAA